MTAFVDPMDDDDHAPSGSPPPPLPSLLPPPPPRSPTPSRSGDSSGSDDGDILTPCFPAHRSGLQPRKGCLKPPGQPPRRVTRSRSRRGVTFLDRRPLPGRGGPLYAAPPGPREAVTVCVWEVVYMGGSWAGSCRKERRARTEGPVTAPEQCSRLVTGERIYIPALDLALYHLSRFKTFHGPASTSRDRSTPWQPMLNDIRGFPPSTP